MFRPTASAEMANASVRLLSRKEVDQHRGCPKGGGACFVPGVAYGCKSTLSVRRYLLDVARWFAIASNFEL